MTAPDSLTVESLFADLDKAGTAISQVLNKLENRYMGTVSVELIQMRGPDGRHVRADVRLELGRDR